MCDICNTINKSLNGENPYFVKATKTGIVVLGWNQHFYGYTIFHAEKMNYECLGNGDTHLHFHLFPRKHGDLGEYGNNGKGPVWWLPQDIMWNDDNKPDDAELEKMKNLLYEALSEVGL